MATAASGATSRRWPNARTATTLLSRRRVERDEVELFLAGRTPTCRRRTSALALDAAAGGRPLD